MANFISSLYSFTQRKKCVHSNHFVWTEKARREPAMHIVGNKPGLSGPAATTGRRERAGNPVLRVAIPCPFASDFEIAHIRNAI